MHLSALNYFFILSVALLFSPNIHAQEILQKTSFNFGGYIKTDLLNTWYNNGDVDDRAAIRDFHIPGQIPVGERNRNYDLDYNIKESRFNFDVTTTLLGKEVHGFLELDFLLPNQGDEKVSNSFNPRIRHFYFEWDKFTIGQTWSTFMIVLLPDEIDFTGAMDGLVFNRQPLIRYKTNNWWFSLENPETTIVPLNSSAIEVADADILPDLVVRKNFNGKWGNWAAAGIIRTLSKSSDNMQRRALGYGITTGGKLKIGQKDDDLRIMLTAGQGLGRYLAVNFIAGATTDEDNHLNTIGSLNGYIAYNHYWQPKLSSSFSISGFKASNYKNDVNQNLNNSSYSISGNLKYDPINVLRFGIEYMYGYRELLNGVNGSFHRVQLAAKYTFGYRNSATYEKD